MAEIEVEESFETTTVRRKTVKQSFQIEEVSNFPTQKHNFIRWKSFHHQKYTQKRATIIALLKTKHISRRSLFQ